MGTQDNNFKYWAFISYSHADEEWAKWLHKSLETYRVPRKLVGRKTPHGEIPRDMSVAGYGNTPVAALRTVSLTTVTSSPPRSARRRCVRFLPA